MKCPECKGKSTVQKTEHLDEGAVGRRRLCLQCGHRWYTAERPATRVPVVKGTWL